MVQARSLKLDSKIPDKEESNVTNAKNVLEPSLFQVRFPEEVRYMDKKKDMNPIIAIIILILAAIAFFELVAVSYWLDGIYPFVTSETRTVNVTEVQFMNSGIIVWGYWDNSTVEESLGLFQSGFMHSDVNHTYEICFKDLYNQNIRCLELVKKIEVS